MRQTDALLLAACWARLTLPRISVADLVQMLGGWVNVVGLNMLLDSGDQVANATKGTSATQDYLRRTTLGALEEAHSVSFVPQGGGMS